MTYLLINLNLLQANYYIIQQYLKIYDDKRMNIKSALLDFSKENIGNLSSTYKWPINLDHLPIQLNISGDGSYEKNIDLRFQLHSSYLSSETFEEKYSLIKWYIYNWGGVKTNNQKTLELYTSSSPQELIERGAQGIASWSKALSIINPTEYAIYDARVAMSINALQIIYDIDSHEYYPPLLSRNKTINSCKEQIKTTIKQWKKAKDTDFYQNYLNLLKEVANDLGNNVTHHDIEMLLFAYAEELALLAVEQVYAQNKLSEANH